MSIPFPDRRTFNQGSAGWRALFPGRFSGSGDDAVLGPSSHRDQLHAEQVNQLYSLAPIGLIATCINSLLVYFVMTEILPWRWMLLWLAAVLAISAFRVWLVQRYRRLAPDASAADRWEMAFIASLVLIGLAWGSVGLFPFNASKAHQVFLAFVLGGMAAGASSTFSKVRSGYAAFSLPALLPIALHFLSGSGTFHHAMGAMTLLYLFLLGSISQHNYGVNLASLQLKFENQDMIEGLRQAKSDVEVLNAQLREEIVAKEEAEAELLAYHQDLERQVAERTRELRELNEQLQREIDERKGIEAALLESRTRLVAAKESAEAGNAAKTQFVANMSHEMRTPLAGVLGMLKLVLEMEIGEEQRQLLQMAERSATSLLGIIADVLDFSRLEAGVLRFEERPYPGVEVVTAAIEVLSFSAQEKGLEIGWKVDGEVPEEVVGDPARVRQVLVNLLGNAVKFTEQGSIEVGIGPSPDAETRGGLLFSVRDTGIGIPPEHLETIFGKFTQIDSSLTKGHGGTGLGLALSREIVEKMGGRIWAESTLGSGSTFHFTVPPAPPAR